MNIGVEPPDRSAPPLLRAVGLNVRVGHTDVLRDVAFSIRRGEVFGLIGESGAGKSMIGRVIAQQLPPGFAVSSGLLRFGTTDLLGLSPVAHRKLLGREIAFIPQEPMMALNPGMTIGQHFVEHLGQLGLNGRAARQKALSALEDVRIASPAAVYDQYPFQLSGGMCQRVLIALAFISQPDLVVADEPTASLDVTSQAHIVGLLRRMNESNGAAVLFISHQLALAAQICDSVAVLYAGEIVESGTATQIFHSARHAYMRALQASAPALEGERRPLASLRGHMPSLREYANLNGCRFAARCASATPECAAGIVPLKQQDSGALCRCIKVDAQARVDFPKEGQTRVAIDGGGNVLVRVQSLSKSFQRSGLFTSPPPVHALRNASFEIHAGEFVGVVGESGSGKSTLGRLLMGLEAPTTGTIELGGAVLGSSEAEWRRRIASIQLVFQDPRAALNPRRNVLDLATQALRPGAASPAERKIRAEQLLQSTGLPLELLSKVPSEMSGGQRQRVAIARALCNAPQLLIADEITSGLDVSVQAQVLNLLLSIRDEFGIALLMISHDLPVVRYLCSRVLVMWKGEIVESGPTEQVFRSPKHRYTRELVASIPPVEKDPAWAAPGDLVQAS